MNWKPMHVLSGVSASVGAVMLPAGPENGDRDHQLGPI